MANTSRLVFVTGGVRSGKSSFAERLAEMESIRTEGSLHYIATGVNSDSEMAKRIVRHQQERTNSELDWNTWEQSHNVGNLAPKFSNKDIILLDCLTTLLNNEFFTRHQDWDEKFQLEVQDWILTGIDQLREKCHTLIVVSNELLHEGLLNNDLVFIYGRLIGRLHQQLVTNADQAYLIESGIPILMKGERR
ncbi:bifunctional adenosylcobinamide kinase/adenosylcobinamide-phosphate guanylyltransferase [Bacillus sp. 31A1R]|uniref:Adenosylcobinamide kinase n=1 Tax=Robertmurraya mangrovi TaxID=3098077 RepID=A0ABU5J4E3_9BACI|nr:bifunctional adenosylcobinamide kinase/adenosylcobinamide-phosphate guanylyltransferase [Bacillus sp. 31A1R]MDZ5474211.1 bifunctional adenosylcobinamide kinase/adenosylcobinamide-phosphate guanylyltransferase [Bacillus sp. 31A1R]